MAFKKDKGYEDYLKLIMNQGKQVRMGTTTPSELPYYKYLEQGVTQSQKQMIPEITKQAMAQGYTGGGLNEMYRKAMETGITGRLGAERQAWEGVGAEGMEAAKTMGALTQAEQKMLMDAIMQQKAINAQKDIAKMSQISGAASGAMPCCFMFIMGEGKVIDQVQKFKHEHFGYNSNVANGYRWMSLRLMPIIRKHRRVKNLIRLLITQPLSKFAVHADNDDLRKWLYVPAGLFWCTIWEIIGRITEYNSNEYQVMVRQI